MILNKYIVRYNMINVYTIYILIFMFSYLMVYY